MYTHIIIHYDEIALKKGNRPFFERTLTSNIKESLEYIKYDKIYKEDGKIIIDITSETDLKKIKETLENIPGISNFYFAVSASKDLEKINKKTVKLLNSSKKAETKKTFKINARRSDKSFDLKSPQINTRVGEYVLKKTALKVDVYNPDVEIIVDVSGKRCFIYFDKIKGIGGLPVGTAGSLISLISGGIDSPVASFMMMRRGSKIVFVHFKNRTIHSKGNGKEKIEKLVRVLSKFQGKSKLYVIPFEEFQKEIIAKIPAKNRMIVYRRTMFKLSEIVARKEKIKGFVTGDSLSQVASQTVENINVIYNATNFPIFSPLIGMNKQEIVDLAKNIKTYNTSNIPYQDCCSFLITKHPETKADLKKILDQERNLDIDKKIEKAISNIRPNTINLLP
jgi:thiamine biosynthesis protein ThiI